MAGITVGERQLWCCVVLTGVDYFHGLELRSYSFKYSRHSLQRSSSLWALRVPCLDTRTIISEKNWPYA